jgi:hypothetical protein
MKRSILTFAFAAGVLALMSGAADALTVTFRDPPVGAAEGTVTVDAIIDAPAGVQTSLSAATTPETIIVTITGAFLPASHPTTLTLV